MRLSGFFMMSIMIALAVACEKAATEDVLVHVHNATIKVSVSLLQGGVNGQINYIPVSGTIVELYTTEYDRDNSIQMLATHHSDSSGLAIFTELKEEYYYLRVSHPSYGIVKDETATPDGSVSLVQIDF